MAIKLTDIVGVMKDKWTYDNHNTQYPSLLITPPTSVFPEVGLDNGWENYTFEVYFSDLYNQTAQANEEIDLRWQNLQDLGTEWLDNFLKNYQATAPILAFLEDESVTLERNKEVGNDKLIQIKMTFTWRVLSKCFRPQSTYPNQLPASTLLTLWLSADSGVSYSTPTKRVDRWADRSGSGNDVAQSTNGLKPLRYTYQDQNADNFSTNQGVFNGKTRISFDKNEMDYLGAEQIQFGTPLLYPDFTIFIVAAYAFTSSAPQESFFAVEPTVSAGQMELGQNSLASYQAIIKDASGNTITALNNTTGAQEAVLTYRLEGDTMKIYANGVAGPNYTTAGFDATGAFMMNEFFVGAFPSIATSAADGSVAEIIIYNSALNNFDRGKIEDYLNNKYKLY